MTEIILDGSAVKNMDDVHNIFINALSLPSWYGRNLDALYDCLTCITEETTVTLMNLSLLEAAAGSKWPALLRMLYDAAEENHRVTVKEINDGDNGE